MAYSFLVVHDQLLLAGKIGWFMLSICKRKFSWDYKCTFAEKKLTKIFRSNVGPKLQNFHLKLKKP